MADGAETPAFRRWVWCIILAVSFNYASHDDTDLLKAWLFLDQVARRSARLTISMTFSSLILISPAGCRLRPDEVYKLRLVNYVHRKLSWA